MGKEIKKIDGQKIVRLYTLKSWYYGETIEGLTDDNETVRIPVSTVLQMLNDYIFVAKKTRKYFHLVEAVPVWEHENLTKGTSEFLKEQNN